MKSRTRWISIGTALPTLIVAGMLQAPPAHAGFGSKLKKKIDKVTKKVDDTTDKATAPAREAQQKVDEATNKATAPVREVQQADAQMQQKAQQVTQTPAQIKAQAMARANTMKAQVTNAARLTDRSFAQDAVLKRLKIDALPSPDGQTLRLIGTVSTTQEKMRAQQLALRNTKNVVNEIKVVPKTAPVAAKAAAKAKANKTIKK